MPGRLTLCLILSVAIAACASLPQFLEPVAVTGPATGLPLDDAALRALLVDSCVTPQGRGDDGPFERFLANGVYQGGRGWGVVFEGLFEIRDAAVCVRGEDSAPICRRVVANADGSYTFIDTADGSSILMTIARRR